MIKRTCARIINLDKCDGNQFKFWHLNEINSNIEAENDSEDTIGKIATKSKLLILIDKRCNLHDDWHQKH